ncbi:MAG: FKBP-type peptidyl-prolyl cis-trans isomerase [Muribaculaceae bacterium]|nr:FKBP-type peptidyl-prolyl cis-trans isomerase [Muribaculaceae bacterium]
MNKLFTAACVASLALASMSSCCGKGSCANDSCDADATVSKAVVDSISMAQGAYIGQAVLSNYPMMQREGAVSKEDIIKGIQTVFGANDNRGTQIGIQFGLQMLNEMKQLEGLGIKVDRSVMLSNFKKAFLQDSIDQEAAQSAYAAYQGMVNKVQAEQKAREEARIAASPEAKANVAAGEEFLTAAVAADPAIQKSASGLGYKIEAAGEGKAVEGATRLKLKYVEKKIDGTEIVKTNDTGRTTYINNVTPGFAEGLKMLSNGGKAVFYVPGEIAYGVAGIPSRNVGPNEMMVYEVEVIDVE